MVTSHARSSQVSQETHLHLELGAHQVPVMPPDRHRRSAVCSLDYICVPVCLSRYLYNVSMDLGWGLAGGGWCIEVGYSNYSVCMFSSPPLSCYINIQSFGQRLKVHSGNID